jgi:hypothetical protein
LPSTFKRLDGIDVLVAEAVQRTLTMYLDLIGGTASNG